LDRGGGAKGKVGVLIDGGVGQRKELKEQSRPGSRKKAIGYLPTLNGRRGYWGKNGQKPEQAPQGWYQPKPGEQPKLTVRNRPQGRRPSLHLKSGQKRAQPKSNKPSDTPVFT